MNIKEAVEYVRKLRDLEEKMLQCNPTPKELGEFYGELANETLDMAKLMMGQLSVEQSFSDGERRNLYDSLRWCFFCNSPARGVE